MTRVYVEGNHNCVEGSYEYNTAVELGERLATKGYAVVSAARKGVSDAVFTGALRADDNSTRVAIDCCEINLPRNNKFTKEIIADNYFDMKMKNCINSDAFIFLPGSFEVMSNIGIILQLKQLELMGNKPVVVIGDQLKEALNTFAFYSEEVVDALPTILWAKNAEDAVKLLNAHFNK